MSDKTMNDKTNTVEASAGHNTPSALSEDRREKPLHPGADERTAAATDVPHGGRLAHAFRRFLGLLPTAAILAVLAGLGYWGHHTGWSMSKFSEVAGNGTTETDDWCTAHGVPESICIACNADLMPKAELHGWCAEHGVHECPFEHPDVVQLEKTPEIEKRDLQRAERALKLRKRSENNPGCQLHLRRIQFVSKEAVGNAGIDIGLVDRRTIVESIPASGEVTYDQTRIARLSSRAPGTVWKVYRNIGDDVRKGDVLAVIDASEVGRLKAELLAAITDYDLKKIQRDQLQGVAGSGVAERVLQEAEASLSAAHIRVQRAVQSLVNLGFPVTAKQVLSAERKTLPDKLRFLGLPEDVTRYLNPETTTSNLIPLRAPSDGIVVARDVVAGEVVDSKQVLFTVVDTSHMWLMLNVASEQAPLLKLGRKVLFRPDGDESEITGRISWISTKVDPHTRTVEVRVELPNRDGRLRNETFGEGRIVLREDSGSIVVPNEAVHWEGCCHVVFVRDKNYQKDGSYKVFHTRVVRPGARTATHTEILAGLMPWEVVVTEGGGVLRAELLKGNLGPG